MAKDKIKVVINGKTSWLTENQYQNFLMGTTSPKTRLIIDSSGPCAGIGSDPPSERLHIDPVPTPEEAASKLQPTSAGNVGIGPGCPSKELHIGGNVFSG